MNLSKIAWNWEPHPIFGRQPDIIGILALLTFAYFISQDYIGAKAASVQCDLHPTMAKTINTCLEAGGEIRADFCLYRNQTQLPHVMQQAFNFTQPGATPDATP